MEDRLRTGEARGAHPFAGVVDRILQCPPHSRGRRVVPVEGPHPGLEHACVHLVPFELLGDAGAGVVAEQVARYLLGRAEHRRLPGERLRGEDVGRAPPYLGLPFEDVVVDVRVHGRIGEARTRPDVVARVEPADEQAVAGRRDHRVELVAGARWRPRRIQYPRHGPGPNAARDREIRQDDARGAGRRIRARPLALRPHGVECGPVERDERVRGRAEARRGRVLCERTDLSQDGGLGERLPVVGGQRVHDGVLLLAVRVREATPHDNDAIGGGIHRDVGGLVDALAFAERRVRVPSIAVGGGSRVDDLRAVLLVVAGEHGVGYVHDAGGHLLDARIGRVGWRGIGNRQAVGRRAREQRDLHVGLVQEPARLARRAGALGDFDRVQPGVGEAALGVAFRPAAEEQRAVAGPVEGDEVVQAQAGHDANHGVCRRLVADWRHERRRSARRFRFEPGVQVALPCQAPVLREGRAHPRFANDVRAIHRPVVVEPAEDDERVARHDVA